MPLKAVGHTTEFGRRSLIGREYGNPAVGCRACQSILPRVTWTRGAGMSGVSKFTDAIRGLFLCADGNQLCIGGGLFLRGAWLA